MKFSPTNNSKLTLISTNITWGGSPYLPVVLTARDDHSVGEKIGTNNLSGYYADTALDIDALTPGTIVTLQNLRIANAQTAININGKNGHRIDHFQCVTAKVGVQLGTATNSLTLRNALFHNVNTNLLGVSGATVSAEHLTVDTASNLNHAAALTLNLTNSLLVAVCSTSGISAQDSVSTVSSAAGIFTTVGSASHYLADGTYRNSGNANVSILSDIRMTTTYPPIVLGGDFTLDTTLNPQAGRDTDIPDRGYHYWPLDYCWTALNLTNATLTLANGVAIGVYGNKGTTLQDGAKFYSEGNPLILNHICRYNAVQEQPSAWGSTTTPLSLLNLTTTFTTPPQVRLRFTDASLLAGGLLLDVNNYNILSLLSFSDCQLRGCQVGSTPLVGDHHKQTVAFTNTLAQRCSFSFSEGGSGDQTPVMVNLRNNLFRLSTLSLANYTNATTWEILDNLFDTMSLSLYQAGYGANGNTTNSYNGYYNTTALPGPSTGNVTIYNVDYQAGGLGSFYYPTNGTNLNNLRNVGSRNADVATLYHYTTTTNNTKETNSVVDIGWHQVATEATGAPLDTDGDGVADYYEDINGNGTVDSGETDWQSYNSLYGVGSGPGLQVFTPLK